MKVLNLLAASLLATVLASAARAEEYQPNDVNYEQPPAMPQDAYAAGNNPWWSLYSGAEATYLALNAHNLETDSLTHSDYLHFGFGYAPRVWLGAQNQRGRGVQLRYWQYQTSAHGEGFVDTVAGGGAIPNAYASQETNTVQLYTIDAEGTLTRQSDDWWIQGTFGARHGQFQFEDLRGAVLAIPPGPSSTISQTRTYHQEFNGTGLTGAIQFSRRLSSPEWELFGSFRGSLMWGTQRNFEHRNDLFGGNFYGNNYLTDYDQTSVSILETQVGLQWTHPLACCHGEVFVRTAFEYQFWDMVTLGAQVDPSQDLNLIGGTFAVGLRR